MNKIYLPQVLKRAGSLRVGTIFDAFFDAGPGKSAGEDGKAILFIEYLSDRSAKFLVWLLRIGVLASTCLLGVEIWWRVHKVSQNIIYTTTPYIINTAVAAPCLLAILIAAIYYIRGVGHTLKLKKKWNSRRKRYCILGGLNLLFEILVSAFYLVPNSHAISKSCSWVLFRVQLISYFRWCSISAIFALQILQAITLLPLDNFPFYKGDCRVGIDLSSWVYVAVFLIVFVPLAIIHFFRFALQTDWFNSDYLCAKYYTSTCDELNFEQSCQQKDFVCSVTSTERSLTGAYVFLVCFTMIVYFGMLIYAKRALKKLPYADHRISYIELGFQQQTRALAALFYVISFFLIGFVSMGGCSSLLANVMGHPSFQVVLATMVFIQTFLSTPATSNPQDLKLHVWLQDFAWRDKEIQEKLDERPFKGEPVFCYETTLKLFYFCNLVYDIDEVPGTPFTPEVAQGLYNLTNFRMIWKQKLDAKCVVGWNSEEKMIVLAFRGTASMANVVEDIKAWRAAVPPFDGRYWLGTQPMVHKGFLETWETSGLKEDTLLLLNEIFSSNAAAAGANADRPWKILLTGHSLGAALSHLAAYDITHAPEIAEIPKTLTAVTFGAPRTGNYAFARRFRKAVPDSWDVFHSDDAVSRAGKFIFLYKRASKTVFISKTGDLIVRPTYAETIVRKGLASSVKMHLLSSYAHSLAAALRAELGRLGQGPRHTIASSGFNQSAHLEVAYKPKEEPAPEEAEEGSAQAERHSLQDLLQCHFMQAVLTSTGGMRQVSLLKLAGARSSAIQRAAELEDISLMSRQSSRLRGCFGACGSSKSKPLTVHDVANAAAETAVEAPSKMAAFLTDKRPWAWKKADLELNVQE